jgi:hypothetical protein
MDTEKVSEFLLELVQQSTEELLKIYHGEPNRRTLLKFPQYRIKKDIRISEQELRFVLTSIHDQNKFPEYQYSVETPTESDYSFEGKIIRRSAATDLSFYDNDIMILNIELKAHNPSPKSIDKDIEKLFNEDCNGAWIHILKNEDRGTVAKLFEKFTESFHIHKHHSKRPISFHIIILETQTLLSRKGRDMETRYTDHILNIDYSMWKGKPKGKYQFINRKPISGDQKPDWQIDVFDIKK